MKVLAFLTLALIRVFYTFLGAMAIHFAVKDFKKEQYFLFGFWVVVAVDIIAKLITTGV